MESKLFRRNRIVSLLLTLCMVLALLPGTARAAEGTGDGSENPPVITFEQNGNTNKLEEDTTEEGIIGTAEFDPFNGQILMGITPTPTFKVYDSKIDGVENQTITCTIINQGKDETGNYTGIKILFSFKEKPDPGTHKYYISTVVGDKESADRAEVEVYVDGSDPNTPAEPTITATGTQDGTIVVTLKDGTFDATEAAKTNSWNVGTTASYQVTKVELNPDKTQATLTLARSVSEAEVYVSVGKAAITGLEGAGGVVSCTATITSSGSDTITVKPTVTATPSTFDVGTTEVKVTLRSTDASFVPRLDRNMFTIDSGTTRLSLISVESDQPNLSISWHDAVLTFADNTYLGAYGPAQAGELKITAKSVAFSSPNVATVIEDAATVTITIGSSSSGSDTPPIIDIPVTPSTPSTGGTSPGATTPSTDTTSTPDGSTTTTKTDAATGTVTETTKAADGSETVVETKTDGTVTTTATDPEGNRTATTANPDGSAVTVIENKDGGASTTTVSASGQVTASVTAPAAAVEAAQTSGQAVSLPMPEVPLTTDASAAPTVTIATGSGQPVKVEIPVEKTTPGTVAVIVKADGTEEVVKTSLATESGVTLAVSDGATVKIVDNSKSFADTAAHWAGDAITFAVAHELFNGTGADSFTPNGTMTRGMMVTVLARYDGVDTSAGATWYEKGVEWAAANDISSGADLDTPVSREQLAAMLYRYAAVSGLDTAASGALTGFADAGSVSDYAAEAMVWAVGAGLIGGTDKGELNPTGSATRAEVAAILMRFCENVMK